MYRSVDERENDAVSSNSKRVKDVVPGEVLNGSKHVAKDIPPLPANTPKTRKVDLSRWNEYKPLDWSVGELDEFLKTKSTELTSREMASLMGFLFPNPKGGEECPNMLKAGSIPLREQMRLCEKYLKPEDQQVVQAGIWAKYRSSNALEEYRQDVLEQMKPGQLRTSAFGAYYAKVYNDYPSIKKLLISDEISNLGARGNETQSGRYTDYSGAIAAVKGVLRDALEKGDASADEIVATLKASKLTESGKAEVIRSIQKRDAELVILRNNPESNKRK